MSNIPLILEAFNLHKSYSQAGETLHVLKGVGLEISSGEMIAIIGPSGAGKSTLLHILGGLDNPDEGKVVLEGEEIYRLNDVQRAGIRNKRIGFVFQFYHLLPEFSALENVMLPLLIKEDQKKTVEHEEKCLALLEKVGLSSRATHKPYQLSGGEQQRVAIARALINEPRIIFCDEPTGNLDSQSGEEIIRLLMELNKKNHQTLVIVTHDEEIARLADRVIPIRDGQLV